VLVKNFVIILMIMLFGVSASGATIKMHYCCGKLKSISWGHLQEKDCGMQGKMGNKCCETKSLSAKDQSQDHEVYTIAFGVKAPVEPAVLNLQLPSVHTTAPVAAKRLIHNSPPLTADILVLHCVFRI
jgi:hypothetical protein